MSVLTIEGLTVGIHGKPVLRGVDLQLEEGRIQGVAGESGSGKTMTGLAVMGLLPGGSSSGRIDFDGTDLLSLSSRQWNNLRGNDIAMVFQDPSTSMHPMIPISVQLTDHLRHHLGVRRRAALARAAELLAMVRVPDPENALRRYPHQFSGGQRQRIAIAIALACQPRVLIADEPTTALDVTVQAGLLHLLRDLTDRLGLSILFVTHDLGVMSAVADDVAVMRDGVVVENGPRGRVFTSPQHQYTRSLLASLPGAAAGLASLEDVRALAAQADPAESAVQLSKAGPA